MRFGMIMSNENMEKKQDIWRIDTVATDSSKVYKKRKKKKTGEIYLDIPKDVETRFYTSNCELDRPLPKEKNKKVIRLMKDKLNVKTMTEFVTLTPKTCSYLTDKYDKNKMKKAEKSVS